MYQVTILLDLQVQDRIYAF